MCHEPEHHSTHGSSMRTDVAPACMFVVFTRDPGQVEEQDTDPPVHRSTFGVLLA